MREYRRGTVWDGRDRRGKWQVNIVKEHYTFEKRYHYECSTLYSGIY